MQYLKKGVSLVCLHLKQNLYNPPLWKLIFNISPSDSKLELSADMVVFWDPCFSVKGIDDSKSCGNNRNKVIKCFVNFIKLSWCITNEGSLSLFDGKRIYSLLYKFLIYVSPFISVTGWFFKEKYFSEFCFQPGMLATKIREGSWESMNTELRTCSQIQLRRPGICFDGKVKLKQARICGFILILIQSLLVETNATPNFLPVPNQGLDPDHADIRNCLLQSTFNPGKGKYSVSSDRGISFTALTSKLFSGLISVRLSEWVETYNTLESQACFRPIIKPLLPSTALIGTAYFTNFPKSY